MGTMHVHDSVREAWNASADHPIIGQVGKGDQLLAISEGTQKSYYLLRRLPNSFMRVLRAI
jgi:hypothetical protein